MAKKRLNSNYGYAKQKETEARELQKREEMKAYRRQFKLTIVLGFLFLIAAFCLAMINLSHPNMHVDRISYLTMSISMFLFMYHFRDTNKKLSTVSMLIGLISTICFVILMIDYTPEISMVGGLFSKE